MKKRIILAMLVIASVSFVGCATTDNEYNTVSKGILNGFYVHVDEETGVNYFVYDGYYKGGITPRYNTDGSLYVTK